MYSFSLISTLTWLVHVIVYKLHKSMMIMSITGLSDGWSRLFTDRHLTGILLSTALISKQIDETQLLSENAENRCWYCINRYMCKGCIFTKWHTFTRTIIFTCFFKIIFKIYQMYFTFNYSYLHNMHVCTYGSH